MPSSLLRVPTLVDTHNPPNGCRVSNMSKSENGASDAIHTTDGSYCLKVIKKGFYPINELEKLQIHRFLKPLECCSPFVTSVSAERTVGSSFDDKGDIDLEVLVHEAAGLCFRETFLTRYQVANIASPI